MKCSPMIQSVPANEASWEDIQAVFGVRRAGGACSFEERTLDPSGRCILVRRESFAAVSGGS